MFHPVPNWVKEGCIHIAENGVPKMWGFWNPVLVCHESLQLGGRSLEAALCATCAPQKV